MPASAPASRHPLRRIALAVLAVVLVLVIALGVYVHHLLQPQRFTRLLESDLAGLGIRLDMSAPAEPALFPRPAVQLHGFRLTNVGSGTPVLQAAGATIVVPWRALLHGEVAIERVEVDAPRVDLGEMEALLARLPHHAGPPRLPTIATGVHMRHGTLIRHGSPLLFDFSLATGALAPGREFRVDMSARSASGRRFSAVLATVPYAARDGVIELDSLHLGLAGQPDMSLELDGKGSWRGGEDLTLQLAGTLRHPALAPPASASTAAPVQTGTGTSMAPPALAGVGAVTDKVAVQVAPARGGKPMTVMLQLHGNDARADLSMRPAEFAGWWSRMSSARPGEPPVPLPVSGTAQASRIDLGWIKATGITISADADLAAASSTAAPASAASAAPRPAAAH